VNSSATDTTEVLYSFGTTGGGKGNEAIVYTCWVDLFSQKIEQQIGRVSEMGMVLKDRGNGDDSNKPLQVVLMVP
jgi:hypothetical protein